MKIEKKIIQEFRKKWFNGELLDIGGAAKFEQFLTQALSEAIEAHDKEVREKIEEKRKRTLGFLRKDNTDFGKGRLSGYESSVYDLLSLLEGKK